MTRHLQLEVLSEAFAVAQLPATAPVPAWLDSSQAMTAIVRTDEELSIVAAASSVPADVPSSGPWRALKVRGPLDFELIGILADLANVLADAGISLFAISTYNTDYVLIRSHTLTSAIAALRDADHEVLGQP